MGGVGAVDVWFGVDGAYWVVCVGFGLIVGVICGVLLLALLLACG